MIEAPRELVHNEAFNVGQTAENYRVREVAEMVAEIVPGAKVTYAPGASPDHAQLPRQLRQDPPAPAEPTSRNGPCAGASSSSIAAYARPQLTEAEDFFGPRYMRLKHV